ncbi:MAG: hypothetical protein JMN24_16110 [gamma proteobacterium endosymbiont of Lamellibrachia anaximandri]|nr:hypothetical protein [gamma proteobacterium endosymbiont of Lamellibrachia anaximandri]MBL3619431.1 hypothetical protein [gamma proteobacterium endosymbiont of Lamellibrachia anaximandri]
MFLSVLLRGTCFDFAECFFFGVLAGFCLAFVAATLPLAKEVFDFPGVRGVFTAASFVDAVRFATFFLERDFVVDFLPTAFFVAGRRLASLFLLFFVAMT